MLAAIPPVAQTAAEEHDDQDDNEESRGRHSYTLQSLASYASRAILGDHLLWAATRPAAVGVTFSEWLRHLAGLLSSPSRSGRAGSSSAQEQERPAPVPDLSRRLLHRFRLPRPRRDRPRRERWPWKARSLPSPLRPRTSPHRSPYFPTRAPRRRSIRGRPLGRLRPRSNPSRRLSPSPARRRIEAIAPPVPPHPALPHPARSLLSPRAPRSSLGASFTPRTTLSPS